MTFSETISRLQAVFRSRLKSSIAKRFQKKLIDDMRAWKAELEKRLLCNSCGKSLPDSGECLPCVKLVIAADQRTAKYRKHQSLIESKAKVVSKKSPVVCVSCGLVIKSGWQSPGSSGTTFKCGACVGVIPQLDRPVIMQTSENDGRTVAKLNFAGGSEGSPWTENAVRAMEDNAN
jgi:predicted RNA-binding Zn-ribbon protein involved in translation (DUF1610 family)